MTKYSHQSRFLVAIDCIIFGFDGEKIRILLIKRGFEPMKGAWSLMGGFVQPGESADDAARRILHKLSGLEGVYLEQLRTFSDPDRDPIERTLSVAYFALIDIQKYRQQITDEYQAIWFALDDMPALIFDHGSMVQMAREKLKHKAAASPILFELLPEKFTLPDLQSVFEDVYQTQFDQGNFSRKIISTKLLIRQPDKDMRFSKKGAYYYKLDKRRYRKNFQKVLKIVPNLSDLI